MVGKSPGVTWRRVVETGESIAWNGPVSGTMQCPRGYAKNPSTKHGLILPFVTSSFAEQARTAHHPSPPRGNATQASWRRPMTAGVVAPGQLSKYVKRCGSRKDRDKDAVQRVTKQTRAHTPTHPHYKSPISHPICRSEKSVGEVCAPRQILRALSNRPRTTQQHIHYWGSPGGLAD